MMPLRARIHAAARAANLDQLVIERDYAQSYLLRGISESPALSGLIFKGGTALKKVHFQDYRFSEDLDFSSVDTPASAELEREIVRAVDAAQRAVQEHGGLTFFVERIDTSDHPGGQEAFKIRTRFPWHSLPLLYIKLEITRDEPVLLPAAARTISHGYDESLEAQVRTYDLAEICAEKLRATRQTLAHLERRGWARSRGRDFYDLWHLVRSPMVDWSNVAAILARKCAVRDVTISTVSDVFEPTLLDRVRAEWDRTLGPFVRPLPSVEVVLDETRERLDALLRL